VIGPGGVLTVETNSHAGRVSVARIDQRWLRQAYAEEGCRASRGPRSHTAARLQPRLPGPPGESSARRDGPAGTDARGPPRATPDRAHGARGCEPSQSDQRGRAVAPRGPAHRAASEALRENVDVKLADIAAVDTAAKTVTAADGASRTGDALVLAAGSQPNFGTGVKAVAGGDAVSERGTARRARSPAGERAWCRKRHWRP